MSARGWVARGECRQSRSCYVMGCRSDACRRASTRYVKASRIARMALGVKHGPVGYDCGCRCETCSAARAAKYKAETLRQLRR